MKTVCPECEAELDEDFGIATCPSCGTVCFIDLEGRAVLKEEDPSDYEEDETGADDSASEKEDFQEQMGESEEPDETSEILDSLETLTEDDSEEEGFNEGDDGYKDDLADSLGDYNNESLNSEEDHFEDEASDEEQGYLDEPEESDSEDLTGDEIDEALSELESQTHHQEEAGALDTEEGGAAPSSVATAKPMSAEKFFKDLEVFNSDSSTEDLDHTFYEVELSGWESAPEKEEVIELLADERVGIEESLVREKWLNEEDDTIFVPKINHLRLVYLFKRLSTLPYLDMDWRLSEDQEHEEESESEEVYEEADQEGTASEEEPLDEIEDIYDFDDES